MNHNAHSSLPTEHTHASPPCIEHTCICSYPLLHCTACRLSTRNENVVCLPAKEFQQDGSHESESQLSWGESKMEELQRQQLSSVYHQGITSEGQVKAEEGEGRW